MSMMELLTTFAAFSMAGTVLLSLLPEGGIKRTAGLAVGLLTLMCWAEGLAGLLANVLPDTQSGALLIPSAVSVDSAAQEASSLLQNMWEVSP